MDKRYELELINEHILFVDEATTLQAARRLAQRIWIIHGVGLPSIWDRQTKQYVDAITPPFIR